MPEVIGELIVSADMWAKGERSPGYFGFLGPDLEKWFKTNQNKPFRRLVGRKTYQFLDSLPEDARDEGWQQMAKQPGYLFSKTLKKCDWPGLELVGDDVVGYVRALKQRKGSELRILGSLSIGRQLAEAKLLDRMRLIMCPLAIPESGAERVFEGWSDVSFELVKSKVLDGRVIVLDYRLDGAPPTAGED